MAEENAQEVALGKNSYEVNSYFMQMAKNASERSKFPDAKFINEKEGAVIVNNRVALGVGWNGFAEKLPENEILNNENFRQLSLSAIENAFIFTTVGRFDIKGATVYCTHFPDWRSAQVLIQYEVKKVFYGISIKDNNAVTNADDVMEILKRRKIEYVKFSKH